MPPARLGAQQGGGFFTDVGGVLGDDLRRLQLDPRQRGAPAPQGMAGPAGPASADWASEFGASPMAPAPAQQHARFDGAFQAAQREQAMFDGAFQAARRETGHGWAASFAPGMHGAAMPMGPPVMQAPAVMQQQRDFEKSWQTAQAPHDWAEEFLKYDETRTAADGATLTAEQRELQETARQLLAQSDDPKLKNSKFMNFVEKIGSGEVTFADSKAESADWANEFGAGAAAAAPPQQGMAAAWDDARAASGLGGDPLSAAWGEASQRPPEAYEAWADAFGATEGGDWAEQFAAGGGAAAQAAAFEDSWAEAARETGLQQQAPPTPSEYVFEEHNPFLAEPASYDEALQNAKEAL